MVEVEWEEKRWGWLGVIYTVRGIVRSRPVQNHHEFHRIEDGLADDTPCLRMGRNASITSYILSLVRGILHRETRGSGAVPRPYNKSRPRSAVGVRDQKSTGLEQRTTLVQPTWHEKRDIAQEWLEHMIKGCRSSIVALQIER